MPAVVELDAAPYRDIPRQLRELADDIADGHHPDLRFVIAVLAGPDASVEIRGWGQYSVLEGFGALARALSI